tara:strand:- start:1060 stop:1248 length:189 start_codon:yes stop_codon:yes gene_type:complete
MEKEDEIKKSRYLAVFGRKVSGIQAVNAVFLRLEKKAGGKLLQGNAQLPTRKLAPSCFDWHS